ncbi:MAG TPA: serine/threonine-protein kinase [Roseiflexaceae bacterium]|jgi:serine/threonine-protein kinase
MSGVLAPGTQLGHFQIEVEVGRGGMGVVYRAFDPALNRYAALKILAPHLSGDTRALARFHREAAAAAHFKHPHIAMVYEFGEYADQPYIASEWIAGRTLRAVLIDDGRLPLDRALPILDQLAAALDYAHAHGVIHRDIKPANIMISASDSATIVDFGLAWIAATPELTASGSLFGTPCYMSPEQIRGEPLDGRSDLYSLAVVFYELVAGRPPFDDPATPALFYKHLAVSPPPITELNPSLPIAVSTS